MHELLYTTLAPNVPASLKNIPEKYSLPVRLWGHAFHRLLESLRRAAVSSAYPEVALENLVVNGILYFPKAVY